MEAKERELLVARILSGVYIFDFGGETYIQKSPSSIEKYKAELVYEKSLREISFSQFYTKEQALEILAEKGIWDYRYDDVLKKYEKDVENLKIELYHSFFNEQKSQAIKTTLYQIRKDQSRILSLKDSLNYVTDVGYASMIKAQYLVACGVYREDGSRLFNPDNLKQRTTLLDAIMIEINSDKLGSTQLREIGRTEPWKGIWASSKGMNIFNNKPCDWTDEQRSLAALSKMYDGISEHPECPDEAVIQDDDCLDGWLLLQRKNSQRKKTQNKVDKLIGKQAGASEIFITAPNQKEANKIHELNDIHAKMVRKKRDNFLKNNKGREILDAELPDVRQNIQMQAQREMAQKFGK